MQKLLPVGLLEVMARIRFLVILPLRAEEVAAVLMALLILVLMVVVAAGEAQTENQEEQEKLDKGMTGVKVNLAEVLLVVVGEALILLALMVEMVLVAMVVKGKHIGV